MALQVRRGTNAERLGITPAEGELIFTTDTKQLYVGDGTTAGGITSIAGTIDSLLADTTPQLGGTLDLNNHDITGTGNINITGTIQASGNINLGDGVGSDVINIGGVMSGDLVPNADATHDLGSTTAYWKEAFISQLSVDSQITAERVQADIIADDSTVVFNAATGQIAAAQVSGTFTGNVTGDLLGSVFADDSTAMVDAQNKTFLGTLIGAVNGQVTGDLTGSVFADDSTLIIDAVSGKVDINGGTIDATPIGGNAPAPGAFTTISTTGTATLSTIANTATLNINATTGIRVNETSSTHQRIDLFSPAATGFGTGFLALNNNHNNQYTNDLLFTRTRGTPASPTAAQANDKIGGMTAQVWDGSAYQAGALVGFTTKSISSGNVGANFTISTRNGAIGTLTTKFEVAETGTVKMDTIESLTADTDLNISANGTGAVNISDVIVKLPNLPTSDPSVAGQLWRSGNDVKISTG